MGRKIDNLIGRRFGILLVIKRDFSPHKGTSTHARWLCQCECGNKTSVISASLKNGETKSCGCWKYTFAVTHGMKYSREWGIWKGMRQRCNNKNHSWYHRYGARGIYVCERWSKFQNFYDDMGPRPSDKHSLDRIDNNGPYSPENCRWALPKTQHNNKSTNLHFMHNGALKTPSEIYDEIKPVVSLACFSMRISKYGWDITKAASSLSRRRS